MVPKDKDGYNEYRRNLYAAAVERDPQRQAEKDFNAFSRFYQTTHGRAAHMLNNARSRAQRLGLNCTLTQEWIKEKLDNGLCEVTGIPFVIQMNNGKGRRNNSFSPSIDRINQTGDYTSDNCRITVWIYNRARGAFPDSSFDIMVEALVNRNPLSPK